MTKPMLAMTLVLACLCEPVAAQLVPVEWDAQGRFSKDLPVAPGKFVEACEKLPKGARVGWSFDSAAPLDFNVHYHEGKKVKFPARKASVAKHSGALVTRLEQDYCWMWTNKSAAEVGLRFTLTRH